MNRVEKQIEEVEQEAKDEIAKLVRESRSARDALEAAKLEVRELEIELGKRTIPYGRNLKYSRYPGVPAKVLDAKWRVYKDFVEKLEKEIVPKTRREELTMYDQGHTLEELREMCRREGLVVSGSKKELIARLI